MEKAKWVLKKRTKDYAVIVFDSVPEIIFLSPEAKKDDFVLEFEKYQGVGDFLKVRKFTPSEAKKPYDIQAWLRQWEHWNYKEGFTFKRLFPKQFIEEKEIRDFLLPGQEGVVQ